MSDSEGEDSKCAGCVNHTCGKQIDTAIDKHVICSLCREAVYCSEACRSIDWLAHECPNAMMTDTIGKIVAVPYFYEDMAPQEALIDSQATSPIFQSLLLAHRGSDMQVTQWTQPALVGERARPYTASKESRAGLGKGSSPPDDLRSRAYEVTVTDVFNVQTKTTFAGNVGANSIYKDNKENSRASKIASLPGTKETGSVIFWPEPQFAIGSKMFPADGTDIKVELKVAGLDTITVEFEYGPLKALGLTQRLGRTFTKFFERRLHAKFDQSKGKQHNIKNMQILRANTDSGVQVNLVFIVEKRQKKLVELVDIEVLVPLNQLNITGPETKSDEEMRGLDLSEKKMEFRCDARDVNQMVGLTMALELALNTGKSMADDANTKNLQNTAGIIRKYTRTLLENGGAAPDTVPMEVNTAVYTAVNALYEQHDSIEGVFSRKPAFDNAYYAMHKDDSIDEIGSEIDNLSMGASEGANFKTKAKRLIRGARGKEKGRLRAIEKIISERIAAIIKRFGEMAARKEPDYAEWKALQARLKEKLASAN